MAQMTIDDDLRDLLNDDKITWAQAGEVRDHRKYLRRLERTITRLKDELAPTEEEHSKITGKIEKILGTKNEDVQPAATEPGHEPLLEGAE